jgi:hypothetical protein
MAIIGHGDIASVLTDRDDVTFFASGVSNSQCCDMADFLREAKLLGTMPKAKHLVYFSTLSIYYESSLYVAHKIQMERLIKKFKTSTIIRIGNTTWGKNPNTFINYLRDHPEAEVKKVWRHIIDKEDFLYWVNLIPVGRKSEMNITGRRIWVPDYINELRSGR